MTPSVHISLRVHDVGRSVEFYRRFFGEPAKLKADYAKFVSRDPEIHLALGPGLENGSAPGTLSHLGIRVGTVDDVARWKDDVEARGVVIETTEKGECCYAVQDKFWLTDPDGNRWEIYSVLRDVETETSSASTGCCPR